MSKSLRVTPPRNEAQISTLAAVFAALREARQGSKPRPSRDWQPRATVTEFVEAYAEKRRTTRGATAPLNVWGIAGLKRDEVRIAAVLAWVLDRRGSHGLGDAVTTSLIERLTDAGNAALLDGLVLGQRYFVRREFSAFGVPDDRVDISIVGENCVLFVECKIDAPEGHEQIERYNRLVDAKVKAAGKTHGRVLYLTASDGAVPDGRTIPLTWKDIAAAIRAAVPTGDHRQSLQGQLLVQFADYVRRLH
ncbi:MAG TPA: PD-(D/E)XK nuclease family protein [Kaistia sp.]|nr:PD-(D/E)XK nuclease family protein [Kaistia sp.]